MKRSIALLLSLAALACQGEPSHAGLDEPLRVPNGFFREGELPGIPESEQPEDPEELQELSPRVLTVILSGIGVVQPGQAGFSVRGTVTGDAYSVGIRLVDAGSGYWVRAVGPETIQENEREWEARVDFSPDIEPGTHQIEVVAFDGEGNAGTQSTYRFCVSRAIESSRNACDPTVLPPAALITLRWESDADVDLVVLTPSGITVEATHPTTLDINGGEEIDPAAEGVGILSLDSNGACRRDGVQRETLTWQTSPERGTYEVFARLFEPCGASATPFKVEAHVRTAGEESGTFGFDPIAEPVHGLLLPQQASGNDGNGLFVTTIEFP